MSFPPEPRLFVSGTKVVVQQPDGEEWRGRAVHTDSTGVCVAREDGSVALVPIGWVTEVDVLERVREATIPAHS